MQGDCLSAVLFIIYLAAALQDEENEKELMKTENTRSKTKKQITLDHSYATQEEPETVHRKDVNINPKYADDCSYMTTAHTRFEQQETTSRERLHKYHLNINRTKTERFTVPEPLPPPTKPKINLITIRKGSTEPSALELVAKANVKVVYPPGSLVVSTPMFAA